MSQLLFSLLQMAKSIFFLGLPVHSNLYYDHCFSLFNKQFLHRLLPSLRDKPYDERLAALQLPSLAHRRHRGDMILLYKIINNSDFSTLYTYSDTTITRRHQFKLFKCHSRLNCQSKYFFNRLINDWNVLPAVVVNVNSVNNFKSLLDNHLFDSRFTFV